MVLKIIKYNDEGKLKEITVKKVSIFSSGLMFKSKSEPLLFELKNEKNVSFTSLFCKDFFMIILDKDKNVIDKIYFNKRKVRVKCFGKYFIESLSNIDDSSSEYRKI